MLVVMPKLQLQLSMENNMSNTRRYEYPFTDLEPGTYRYGAGSNRPTQTVTVGLNPGMHRDTRLVVTFTPGYYPSSFKDLPHGVYFEEIPEDETIVLFLELWVGDRFQTLRPDGTPVQVWTKLDSTTARQHRQSEIELKERGYGYVGSATCSFESSEQVKFLPVVLP